LAFAGAVIAANNLSVLWRQQNPSAARFADAAIIAMWLAVAVWIFSVERLTLSQIGVKRDMLGPSLACGIVAGCMMGTLGIAAALLNIRWTGQPIAITGIDPNDLPSPLQLAATLATVAVSEELLFRGLIQTRATIWLGPARAIALCAVLFALWHIAVTALELGQPDATGTIKTWIAMFAGKLIVLAGAGAIFCWLRSSTGSLLGPIAAHWTVDYAVQATILYLLQR
jgi:membrane protease YdiL (CAAX protease family)